MGDKVCWGDIVLDGEELDPPSPLLVLVNKPEGYVTTSPDDENISDPTVYDLLPYRCACAGAAGVPHAARRARARAWTLAGAKSWHGMLPC